jgi:D-alanyl-D-alanine carboxypeptidase (penicillin-binding protein 5/6)
MNDTHFVNCTGLDDGTDAANHLTSAYDIAIMSRELIKNHPDIQKFTTIWMDTVRNGTFGLANTNKLIRFYPGATGLKTGFTANAGYCLSATAERDGLGLIAVVMGCATSQERFAACKQLLDYGFANFALVQPQLPDNNTVAVKLGTADTVTAVPAEDPQFLIDKSQRDTVTTTVELEEQVSAPVSKGQKIGTMTIKAGEQVLTQVSMVAQESVPRLTLGDIFIRILRKMCMAK